MENQIVCTHCNFSNSTKNLFCQNCGKPLTASRQTAPPAPSFAPVLPVAPTIPPPPLPVQPVNPVSEVAPKQEKIPEMKIPTPPPFQPVSTPPQIPQFQPAPIQTQPPQYPPAPVIAPPASLPSQPVYGAEIPMPIPQVPIGEKINRLGLTVDSWADLVDNGAEKGAAISEEFDRSIQARAFPNVLLTRTEMTADGANIGRTVHLLKTNEGHCLAVYFGAQGKDLLVSWDLYIKPKLNILYLAILVGGTAAITLIITLITGILGASFISFIFAWVTRFFNWLLPVILATGLVGLFLRGNFMAFFLNLPSKFSEDDLTALMLAAHQSILKAVEAAGLDAGKLRVKKGFRGGNWFRKI